MDEDTFEIDFEGYLAKPPTQKTKPGDQIAVQQIEYTRTLVPSSMRSPYWQYFGFPADNSNNILTRQKVICTLCNTAIAYNKNTSNLRTHLVARHQELLPPLQDQRKSLGTIYHCSVPTAVLRRATASGLDFEEHVPADEESFAVSVAATADKAAAEVSYSPEELRSCVDSIIEEDDGESPLPKRHRRLLSYDEESFGDSKSLALSDSDGKVARESPLPLRQFRKLQDMNGADFLANILISDLLPIESISGSGMQQLLGFFGRPVPKSEVKEKLVETFGRMEDVLSAYLERLSTISTFSLGVDTYRNVEQLYICDIYLNFYEDESTELATVLYTSRAKPTPNCSLHEALAKISLRNCGAMVVQGDDEEFLRSVRNFAEAKGIPIFDSHDASLTRCLSRILDLSYIAFPMKEILERLQEESAKNRRLHAVLPGLYANCPWTKLAYLQYVFDNSEALASASETHPTSLLELQKIVQFLQPLKLAMETIAEETLPLCTLIRPLTVKLLEALVATDTDLLVSYVYDIRVIVEDELTNCVLKNSFLNKATFFDVRFQEEFSDSANIQEPILERFKDVIEVRDLRQAQSAIKNEDQIEVEVMRANKTKRKSNLKSFFDRINDAANNQQKSVCVAPQRTNVEVEFDRYKCEPTLDLEQCPIKWWQDHAATYEQLRKISHYYLCAPCCVLHRLHGCDDAVRIELKNKRSVLRHSDVAERYLWYLHYNKPFYEKLTTCLQPV